MLQQEVITREVIGAFFTVYNELRHGFLESVYANALEFELRQRGQRVAREVPVSVHYCGVPVGFYRADLVVEDIVLVEIKATRIMDPQARQQILNYLRGTDLDIGLLLHFGPKPHFERVICTRSRGEAPKSQADRKSVV